MTTETTCCNRCTATDSDTTVTIACTLGAGDFNDRVAGIRALAKRWLRTSHRRGLQLERVYAPEALAEVEDLVAKERDCCRFMGFDLEHDEHSVRLTIAAPVDAMSAANDLFAHFAPELAGEAP